MAKRELKNIKGFSLIELVVAIALASVVFIIVGSILATFVTQNTKSERQEMFEQAKNDIVMELSNNIRWGKDFVVTEDTLLIDGNKYHVEDGHFMKNSQNLTMDNVSVKKIEVFNVSTDPNLVGVDMTLVLADRNYPLATDVIHLVVSQRRTDVSN